MQPLRRTRPPAHGACRGLSGPLYQAEGVCLRSPGRRRSKQASGTGGAGAAGRPARAACPSPCSRGCLVAAGRGFPLCTSRSRAQQRENTRLQFPLAQAHAAPALQLPASRPDGRRYRWPARLRHTRIPAAEAAAVGRPQTCQETKRPAGWGPSRDQTPARVSDRHSRARVSDRHSRARGHRGPKPARSPPPARAPPPVPTQPPQPPCRAAVLSSPPPPPPLFPLTRKHTHSAGTAYGPFWCRPSAEDGRSPLRLFSASFLRLFSASFLRLFSAGSFLVSTLSRPPTSLSAPSFLSGIFSGPPTSVAAPRPVSGREGTLQLLLLLTNISRLPLPTYIMTTMYYIELPGCRGPQQLRLLLPPHGRVPPVHVPHQVLVRPLLHHLLPTPRHTRTPPRPAAGQPN